MHNPAHYCLYYQARVLRTKTWFIVGSFRNDEHIAFERTLDGNSEVLEFFVPADQETAFLKLIQYFIDKNYVFTLEKLPNRFAIDHASTIDVQDLG